MRQVWKVMVVLLTGLLLACGADLSSGTGSGLTLRASAAGIKSITFQWSTVAGATHYKLFVDPDGSSGFTQVGGDLTTTSTVVTIPVHLGINARYLVEAHDAGGRIASSSSIGISSLMLDIIGYLKASNTWTGDEFGYRVAVSGDGTTLAVSAYREDSSATGIDGTQSDDSAIDSGAVYLFVRSGETWVQQAYIKASNTDAGDAFGSSLALSSNGDTLAVGATGEDSAAIGIGGSENDNSGSNAGAVYLFTRVITPTGPSWSQQAYIKASNTDALNPGDLFGTSVALSSDGNTLAVGAPGEDSNATTIGGSQGDNSAGNAGAVYLFLRSGSTWSQQAYIKASNAEAGDAFGSGLALSSNGNTLAVGAPGEESEAIGVDGDGANNNASGAGAAYLFTRSGSAWSQQAYVKASNTGAGDAFGTSVALSGDGTTLAVGATGEDSEVTGIDGGTGFEIAANSGAVYLFALGISWTQQAYIKATNTGADDNFGVSVALSGNGNLLAVGADQEDSNARNIDGNRDDNSSDNAGAVYLYTRSASVWSVSHYIKAPNTDLAAFDIFGDRFGGSIAMTVDGNTMAVGALGEDSFATGINGDMSNNDSLSAGAAYLY